MQPFDLPAITRHMSTLVWHLNRYTSNRTLPEHLENAFVELEQLEQDIEMVRTDLVWQARQQGISWSQIGRQLGISKSGAWAKFGQK